MTLNSKTAPSHRAQKDEQSLLAQSCLDYLTSDPEELARFMGAAGYTPQSLRESVATDEFELALLSYFANNEASLLAMCANANINVSRFMRCWNQQNAHI